MKTPLQIIADFGCPTTSPIDAIQFFSDREDLSFEQYKKGIQDIIGMDEPPEAESWFFAKVLFKYIIQETIRGYNEGVIPNMDAIFVQSVNKTSAFIENHPWSETAFNVQHGLSECDEIDPETGEITITKSKGDKKGLTQSIFNNLKSKGASRQDIIEAFVQQTGMSKAGATTYFHALKKEFGFTENKDVEKKSSKNESKQELAERLYRDSTDKSKPTMIALFTEKLETSKLGAQTYFYACKKKFQDVNPTQNP